MATDDTGFLTDSGKCCKSAALLDDCGVCEGGGRSCARLVEGRLATFDGGNVDALQGILQDGLPGVTLTRTYLRDLRELKQLGADNEPQSYESIRGDAFTAAKHSATARGLRNSGGLVDSIETITAAVAYRVDNGSSVIYSSEALAAAFVNATTVASGLGFLAKASLFPTISVQVSNQSERICRCCILWLCYTTITSSSCSWHSIHGHGHASLNRMPHLQHAC